MLLLIMIAEVTAFFALGFFLAASAQGTSRMRDWSLTSLYPRRGSSPSRAQVKKSMNPNGARSPRLRSSVLWASA